VHGMALVVRCQGRLGLVQLQLPVAVVEPVAGGVVGLQQRLGEGGVSHGKSVEMHAGMWFACELMPRQVATQACLRDNSGFGHRGIQDMGFSRVCGRRPSTGCSNSTLKP